MTHRIPLDHLTSDQYDAMCDRIDRTGFAEARRDRYAALLNRTTHLLGITHAHRGQGGHDVLGENLTCAGCALRDEICDALADTGPAAAR